MCIILAVDSGNSRIKWGLHDGITWHKTGNVTHHDISLLKTSWRYLPVPAFIIVSNVAGNEAKNKLTELFKFWSSEALWIESTFQLCGVRNHYLEPAQLGCDRWAALIAGRSLFNQSCLIINVGTAMTVDILSDSGDFLGGIITPGPDTFLKALVSNTVISNPHSGHYDKYPLCTRNAIYTGVVQSLVGAVERIYQQFYENTHCADKNCIITGGSASMLLPHIDFPINVVEKLVLEGLIIIARTYYL